jgi:D-alanyl-D-alanine carboxypeptidase
MTTTVPTDRPGIEWGLGLMVVNTPAGPLLGHDGLIPGFNNIVLSTRDGGRQFGVMMNVESAPPRRV